jgi:hypothetical protein
MHSCMLGAGQSQRPPVQSINLLCHKVMNFAKRNKFRHNSSLEATRALSFWQRGTCRRQNSSHVNTYLANTMKILRRRLPVLGIIFSASQQARAFPSYHDDSALSSQRLRCPQEHFKYGSTPPMHRHRSPTRLSIFGKAWEYISLLEFGKGTDTSGAGAMSRDTNYWRTTHQITQSHNETSVFLSSWFGSSKSVRRPSALSILCEIVRHSMLVNKLSKVQKDEFQEVFSIVDVNKRGKISLLEISEIYGKCLGLQIYR